MSPGRLRSPPHRRLGLCTRADPARLPACLPAHSQVNQALLKEDDDLLRQTFLSVFRDHHPQVRRLPPAAAPAAALQAAAPGACPCRALVPSWSSIRIAHRRPQPGFHCGGGSPALI